MNRREDGFTLIEVLIASAIIVVSLGVLLQLFASGLAHTQRAGQVAHLIAAQRSIVHTLEVVNPALRSEGKGVAEGLRYQWQASLRKPYRLMYDPGGSSRRDVALFALTVSVKTARGKTYRFTLDQLGWRPRP